MALKLQYLAEAQNIAEKLSDERLDEIGLETIEAYDIDLQSRAPWEKKKKKAIELALQLVEEKSYPWDGASNVKFPLLTIAALQFASRAYPALIKAPDLVKFRVQGRDQEGEKSARAHRISAHMSWQLLEQDEDWEEETDRAYLALPILGCVFKKSYRSMGMNKSELVLPMNLVVNYYAKKIEDATRKTHHFDLTPREIRERVLEGTFLDVELSPAAAQGGKDTDKRQGLTEPTQDPNRPRKVLEQHTFLDLDEDGYPEPYIITVDYDSKKVFRIVNRFGEVITEQSKRQEMLKERILAIAEAMPQPDNNPDKDLVRAQAAAQQVEALQAEIDMLGTQKPKVLRIVPVEYFTKIPFIPSPDGGFYDIGFGDLLSPLNDSVDTIINQLIDSGSLNNGSTGFIGKGARIKGGRVKFKPFEWKRVDVAGATLRDALVPLPVNQPSPVLFNLLGLLIQYTERVSSVTDTMAGENPGQNTPAYNMSAMLEQGMQVFNGIFKRIHRAFRSELRKLYNLNALHLSETEYFEYQDEEGTVSRSDYQADPKDLIPAADPNAFSNKEKQMKAGMVAERAMAVPGYDPIKVEQAFLESMDIPNAAEMYPVQQNPETGAMELVFPPGPDPELVIKEAEEQRRVLEAQNRDQREFMLAEAKVALIEAQILEISARAETEAGKPEIEQMKLILEDLKDKRKALIEMAKIDESRRTAEMDRASGNGGASGTG